MDLNKNIKKLIFSFEKIRSLRDDFFCTGNIDRQSHKVVFKPLIEKRNK